MQDAGGHLPPRRRELAVLILPLSFLAFSPDIIFMERDLMEDSRDPRPCLTGSCALPPAIAPAPRLCPRTTQLMLQQDSLQYPDIPPSSLTNSPTASILFSHPCPTSLAAAPPMERAAQCRMAAPAPWQLQQGSAQHGQECQTGASCSTASRTCIGVKADKVPSASGTAMVHAGSAVSRPQIDRVHGSCCGGPCWEACLPVIHGSPGDWAAASCTPSCDRYTAFKDACWDWHRGSLVLTRHLQTCTEAGGSTTSGPQHSTALHVVRTLLKPGMHLISVAWERQQGPGALELKSAGSRAGAGWGAEKLAQLPSWPSKALMTTFGGPAGHLPAELCPSQLVGIPAAAQCQTSPSGHWILAARQHERRMQQSVPAVHAKQSLCPALLNRKAGSRGLT